jgi:hypothetical protein
MVESLSPQKGSLSALGSCGYVELCDTRSKNKNAEDEGGFKHKFSPLHL